MLLKWFANAVVMLLVALGLLLAPLAAPAFAAPVSDGSHHQAMHAMSDDMQVMPDDVQASSDDMQAMADMPCCPGQTKGGDGGPCPFVALCLLNISVPAPSGAVALIERQARHSARVLRNDLPVDGLGAQPPDHPPRTQV
ncbi:hypothetical protein AYJ54_35275 [Bradyrhizobium centrolobii]|uniref:CopL family metal-binding regulatory protein n=1 Tax=Bradyrhizobium centrolobii TaxID=1505087 RepID=A0A176Y6X2_9BRAD|nr:hypothetical protein [Bradyrhizobium centrolobii]OAE97363.1 hypothetical protein AYJ54_35275 [Bradyrhizobium centrolobii]